MNSEYLRSLGKNDTKKFVVLVYGGATGWIGQQVVEILRRDGHTVACARARLDAQNGELRDEIASLRPQRVINCAGVTGRPNVDWCESHRDETIETNVLGTVALARICAERDIHLTNFATGCLYSGGIDQEFRETDAPNFFGSAYSRSKALAERLIFDESQYGDSVLQLRLRMPISDDLHERSFVTKISRYERVVNVPNSVTVLHDLLPIGLDLCLRGVAGIYNFVNPGHVSHNEVLALYKQYVAPEFVWHNFSVDEQACILKAGRSNCVLSMEKLLAEYPDIPKAHEAVASCMQRIAATKQSIKH